MDSRPDLHPRDLSWDPSRLESLLESAKLLGSSLELDDLLRHLLRTVMGRLLAPKALIALHQPIGLTVALSRGLPLLKPGAPFSLNDANAHGLPFCLPLGENANLGYLAFSTPARGPIDEAELDFLSALLSLASTAISNARAHTAVLQANQSLDQRIQELRALLDLVRGLNSTIDAEQVAQLLMLTLSGRWAVRKHALFTWKDNQPPIQRLKGVTPADLETFRAALADATNPVPAGDFLLFPIRSADKTHGLVALGPRLANQPYSPADLDFGMGLVAQASVALDNAWHFRDTLYRQQLEKELSLAASIQQDLFPKALPTLGSSELAARNRQAREVGGDYYDVLPAGDPGPETAHVLCVADISGKGISASLLMANIQATLRALLAARPDLPSLAAQTNDLLWASTPGNKYSTAIFVQYDPASGACTYVNGGHSDGILLRASGEVEMLTTTGLPIGLFPKRTYESASFTLASGDVLLLYSDGVTDACTIDYAEFGVEGATETLRQHAHRPAAEIITALFDAIDAFAAGAPQFDDITILVLKRL